MLCFFYEVEFVFAANYTFTRTGRDLSLRERRPKFQEIFNDHSKNEFSKKIGIFNFYKFRQ